MASYHHLLQHAKPRFESPAKVFAKLKSKVQREAMGAKEGIFTSEDPLFGEKHGAEFISPRKKAKSNWTSDELKENHRFGSYRSEAQALTLSPISSPKKTFGCLYSDISRKPLEETPPEDEPGRGHTRRESAFLESTAMSQPCSLVNRSQILKEPRQIMDGFTVCSRTPVKIQPVSDYGLFKEECAPLNPPMSPANMFSPMRKRLMKRKLDHHEFDKVISSTEEINNEALSQLLDLTTSAFSENSSRNKTKDLDCVRKCSVDQLQMIHEVSLPPPRSIAEKRCNAIMATLPPMSPAKMFAYMKERESKKELQKDCNSSRRDLFNVGNVHRSRDTPLSTDHSTGVMEGAAFRSAPASVVPSNRCKVDSPDSQSDADLSEDVINPTVPPQPVLLEDPLMLNSPQVSIPKKHETVFKRNKWPKQEYFPSESVIYLKKWFLRKNPKGLFVDGIHREDNIPWNSNIIVERVSSSVLKTVSGRVYILVGKMKMDVASDFPKWFLRKFANGFPLNWKALYEKLLSEPREETEKGNGITAKAKSEASSINHRVTRDKQKALRTSDSCPPSSSSSTKVSRSGRVIKPPLEYWKGGRVFLDAFMNVTIHECYDTSICKPAVTTTVPAKKSQKPISVFLPSGEGWKQSKSANKEGAPVLQRRVKPPNRTRAKTEPDQKPSSSPEPVVETLISPEEWRGRTRSSQRGPAKGRELNVDTLPQSQCELEKSSTQRSKKQTHNTDRPSVRASGRKRTVINSPESPSILPSDDDFPVARQTRGKGVYSKKSRNVHKKSPPNRVSSSKSSSESSEERGRKKTTRVTKKRDEAQTKHKPSKYTKPSPPIKPRLTQSDRKHKAVKGSRVIPQEQDMDEWTEEELLKLREAVSYYPKHMAGYWEKVARMVGTRSTEECYNQHTSQGTSQTPAKKAKKPKNEKVEAAKPPVADIPLISARVGTLKRKQQVRQFLENMPKEDVDDVFSSAYMQNKRFEMPSLCLSEDHNCTELEPMTPMSSCFSEVKTPQCLYITPGMMGSPNRNDDKYVYQLQKRMKKKQFNVCKRSSPAKSFTPTPSVKRTMRRCGNTENDTFVVWELFPGHGEAPTESEEEEDFYFSDNN
ncbi:mis18-binding protein 1 isoform X2 [Amphiprion ocellaris]|uniref:Myb-like domain-containing protein n=1 Tax=Amphiprion ocellaris TaxID=80972 RepID=A0A3Q1ATH4_AMPOC|nr:mis18-binding protein 1 isoform X2 [Amphiprion ocellaris]